MKNMFCILTLKFLLKSHGVKRNMDESKHFTVFNKHISVLFIVNSSFWINYNFFYFNGVTVSFIAMFPL